jgi:hypothetical protein
MEDNNYLSRFDDYNRNLAAIDTVLSGLTTKSGVIDGKITMLMNKTVLQLEDSTHLLKFQNTVIRNEIHYLNALKNMINTSCANQFFDISENITMVAVAYLNIYKDIDPKVLSTDAKSDTKVKMSCKKSPLTKILTDISSNMNFIRDLLNDLRIYINTVTGDMVSGNFHCATLHNDLEKKYDSINLEYNKFRTALAKNIDYFTDFTNIIDNHINDAKLRAFCI